MNLREFLELSESKRSLIGDTNFAIDRLDDLVIIMKIVLKYNNSNLYRYNYYDYEKSGRMNVDRTVFFEIERINNHGFIQRESQILLIEDNKEFYISVNDTNGTDITHIISSFNGDFRRFSNRFMDVNDTNHAIKLFNAWILRNINSKEIIHEIQYLLKNSIKIVGDGYELK